MMNKARILLVEDNELNRDMLVRRLRKAGYETLEAIDGPSGIEAAQRYKPDLILMDVALGDMDGWQTTTIIRSMPGIGSVPIVALTAHALESDRQKSIQVGCSDFDTKPVDLARLLGKIEKCLGRVSNIEEVGPCRI